MTRRLTPLAATAAQKSRRALALSSGACCLVACSFFAPSLDEYAQERPGGAGSGGEPGTAGLGGVASGVAGAGGEGNSAGSLAGQPSDQGGAGGAGGGGGAGGEPEEPDPPDMPGQPVTAAEYKLQPVVTRGVPQFALLSAYDVDEATAAASPHPPLYEPYDRSETAYWDYLIGEQLQARAPAVVLPTRGVSSLDSGDLTGPGDMNPRVLAQWSDALTRASATDLTDAMCLVDSVYLRDVANQFHGSPSDTLFDLSVQSDWLDVFWLRAIEPWFDTIPSNLWFTWSGLPLIQLSKLPNTAFENQAGNLAGLLAAIAQAFETAHGLEPRFILDAYWFTLEPGLSSNPLVMGKSPWLEPPGPSHGFSTLGSFETGTVVPAWEGSTSIARATIDTYDNRVVTLLTGLTAAFSNQAQLTLVQGLNNFDEQAGLYRSTSSDWNTPNEDLHLFRRHVDLRTTTLRLEAEACDASHDAGEGNSGVTFLREGDLDVRALPAGGWAVTDSAALEWIEFRNVDFSAGNYKFIAKFSTSNSGDGEGVAKRLQLVLDGDKLTTIILPDTVNSDTFDATLLALSTVTHGQHDVRIRFMDGFVDLDWIFLRKVDPVLSLAIGNGMFESAQGAGGSNVIASAGAASVYEEFTFDDLNGGELEDGDSVHIQVYDGYYLTADSGTGTVRANRREPGADETFTLELLSGGSVTEDGSTIAIRTGDGAAYLTNGAGDVLEASGTSVGADQTFTVGVY
jgi:hypothetical protein